MLHAYGPNTVEATGNNYVNRRLAADYLIAPSGSPDGRSVNRFIFDIFKCFVAWDMVPRSNPNHPSRITVAVESRGTKLSTSESRRTQIDKSMYTTNCMLAAFNRWTYTELCAAFTIRARR